MFSLMMRFYLFFVTVGSFNLRMALLCKDRNIMRNKKFLCVCVCCFQEIYPKSLYLSRDKYFQTNRENAA